MSTVGLDEQMMREYIRNQEREEKRQEQMKDRKFHRVIETWRKKKERWILLSGLNRRPLHVPESWRELRDLLFSRRVR